jgi:predicted nucleic acid-binding protein
MIVADTDVLIDSLHGKGEAAARVVLELEAGGLATTSITAFELLSGAKRKRARDAIGALLSGLHILPLDEAAARRAAEVRRDLEQRGEKIGMADYLIAAICLERRGILLTRNRAHFGRVDGLALADLP